MDPVLYSPLDTRYSRDLPPILSESAVIASQVEVEKKWLLCLMDEKLCPIVDEKTLDEIFKDITADDIEAIERRTQHATRALVEVLSERLKKTSHTKLADWVHVGLTSFDTVDTAQRLRLKRFFKESAQPAIQELKTELKRWAHLHAHTLQVGRTHGQWAVPTFFGLGFAEAHERIAPLEKRIEHDLEELRGQASGAIGGYHAPGLLVDNPVRLEQHLLKKLGLKAHFGSTQILPPEDLVSLAQDFVSLCAVVAKLATDLRHLARSEIAEISEGMAEGQVGSSTMPQKRNPWNLEHVCSLYKVLLSRLQLMQMDMVSEHQRDLTNSASSRFYNEVFAVGYLMIKRLTRVLKRMEAHPENMKKHLDSAGSSVFAEAFYILATKSGLSDAHEKIREASREAERSGRTLLDVARDHGWVAKDLSLEKLLESALNGSKRKLETITTQWKMG